MSVSVDPLFFYLPVVSSGRHCLTIGQKLATAATTLRTIDAFYLIHIALEFRTVYIAPSSRVFGRGELVIDPAEIANCYLRFYFIIEFLAALPLPQVEAFAVEAEELKCMASQFRRLHSRQVQNLFWLYSQQWRTWAARFIQAAWRRHLKRKLIEQRRKVEEEAEASNRTPTSPGSSQAPGP